MKKIIIEVISIILATNLFFSNTVLAFVENSLDKGVINSYPNIILDRDDFYTDEEYEQYLSSTGTQRYNSSDLQKIASTGATASMRYAIYTSPFHTTAIQKTYIGSSYIYILQREGQNMILSRCSLDGSRAYYKDEMTLINFGHSQTLELFEYGGTDYFWIACKASDVTEKYWSTQIGRVEYKAGTTINYTNIRRLSALSKANETGTSYGTIKRVDAALSSDKSILLIWSKNDNNQMQFTFYDATKVNAALNNSSSIYISCDSAAIKKACISSFKTYNAYLENDSCQGLEVSNAKSIYIASGQTNYTKHIIKLNSTGSLIKRIYIDNPILSSTTGTEIEGLQLKDDDVYFGMCNHNGTNKTEQYIFSVPKSVF